jgi:hypothetical protein
MLSSILRVFAFIGVGGAIVLVIATGHVDVFLIVSSFVAALAASALPSDLRLPHQR